MQDRRVDARGRRKTDIESWRARRRLIWAYATCGALFATLMAMFGAMWLEWYR